MWPILFEEFIGDLKGQKTRTALTLLAMIWGTIAVVLLLAFGQGLKVAISTGLLNAGERMFMIWGGETSVVHEGLPKARRIRLMPADMELFQRMNAIYTTYFKTDRPARTTVGVVKLAAPGARVEITVTAHH